MSSSTPTIDPRGSGEDRFDDRLKSLKRPVRPSLFPFYSCIYLLNLRSPLRPLYYIPLSAQLASNQQLHAPLRIACRLAKCVKINNNIFWRCTCVYITCVSRVCPNARCRHLEIHPVNGRGSPLTCIRHVHYPPLDLFLPPPPSHSTASQFPLGSP
jgi:hypothetical protein